MINNFNHFHLVTNSPWPLLSSLQTQTIMISTVSLISNNTSNSTLLLNFLLITIVASIWWNNTITEAAKEGLHLQNTTNGMNISMLMFISSEVLFFSSFFWAYFHAGSSPNVEIGQIWPPNIIESFNPINVPLLNTIILVSSGFSITWSHHLVLEGNINNSNIVLIATCMLGVYFSILQNIEYEQSQFSLNDCAYGTIFFMATGFHGIHVLIGTSFLIVNYLTLSNITNSITHHIGFELAAWYWHFVDVVWLLLYLSIYWWGN